MPKIPIIYEDTNVIVLDKPAGLLTISKGDFNPEPTLEAYGHIVHRLDRDTSGVIILAKNQQTQSFLQKQFANHTAYKTYYAVVVSHPKLDQAIINVPLARNLKSPTTFQPNPKGREAITQYKVINQNDKYSLLELKPTTGRTHQLRIHLAHIDTPILGDKIYGQTSADRMYLHATSLEITIPQQDSDSQRQTFTSKLPQEFQDVLKQP
jgi:RluA family pseudouridine synthase